MTWGVFEIKDDVGTVQSIHVAPCDKRGVLCQGHCLSPLCSCISRVERGGPYEPPIYFHETIQ